jgi:hypothetical protein
MSSSPASRYRTVALDDGEIFYREAGDPSAPAHSASEGTRTHYVDGTPDPTAVNPDLWELDQHYLDAATSQRQPTATRSPS